MPRNRTQGTQECKGAKDHSANGFSISLNGAESLVPKRHTSMYYVPDAVPLHSTHLEQWLSTGYVHPLPLRADAPCLKWGGSLHRRPAY
jgi:hypothetical protein